MFGSFARAVVALILLVGLLATATQIYVILFYR